MLFIVFCFQLTTVALHCMSWILKMDLPALRQNIQNISASIFKLLHKYAAAGLSKGDNFDLVVAAFKVSLLEFLGKTLPLTKLKVNLLFQLTFLQKWLCTVVRITDYLTLTGVNVVECFRLKIPAST